MPRCKWNDGLRLMGRPQTAPRLSWRKTIVAEGLPDVPDGTICDATPAPGRTYTRYTWPPRGRGRGESLISPRRIEAKLRAVEVFRLRVEGYTFEAIGRMVGLSPSGAYRAMRRLLDRMAWDERRTRQLHLERLGLTEADVRSIQSLDDMGID